MLIARHVAWMVSASLAAVSAGLANGQATSTGSGQDYPNKLVRIVTSGVGGSNDFAPISLTNRARMSSSVHPALPVKSVRDRLRGVAVTSAQPSPLVPGLPTIAAPGVPGYQSVALSAVFAPAGTPAPIVNRLNQEIVRILQRPDIKEKYLINGIEAVSSSPQELAAMLASEIAKWGKVIKDAGITGD